jgi:uncharacterized membrane protein YccC
MMDPAAPTTFMGLPWARWLFALRIWAAVVLALGVAFWLQLDGASSAGVCVAVLALQTRGQVLEKAFYRMLGTIVGAIGSIVITDVFLQTRDLYVIACSAWLGLCVFVAGFLDGNRAYSAVLCGYTLSIVAIQRIDTPDQVFDGAVSRAAAIAVGIASVSFVSIVFSAPDITQTVVQRVRAAQSRVHAFTSNLPRLLIDAEAAQILGTISDGHPEIGALSAETLTGTWHARAIRAVAAALVGEVVTARQLAAVRESDPLSNALQTRLRSDLAAYQNGEGVAASALDVARLLPDAPRMPAYRSWENAFFNGLRTFVASALTGFGLVLTGWSATELTWAFVGIFFSLSANAPDPRVLARAALIAMPTSVVLAGVTEFIILDGSDAFPLLCVGLAPAIIGSAILITSPDPKRAGVGSLITVFTLVVLAPNNPQSYDPSTYLIMSMLMILAMIIVYVLVFALFPIEDSQRRAWVLRSARHALRTALLDKATRAEVEARFLDASRIAALSTLKDEPATRHAVDLATLFWLADLRSAVQRVWLGLDRLGAGHPWLRATILAALQQGNTDTLRQTASALIASQQPSARVVAGDIALAAHLVDQAPVSELLGTHAR